jgi:hypothetical protein
MSRLLVITTLFTLLAACSSALGAPADIPISAPTDAQQSGVKTVAQSTEEIPPTEGPFLVEKVTRVAETSMPENIFAPKPGDAALQKGNAFIEGSDLLIMESFPPQIALHLSGNLPTPCNLLRIKVSAPDADNRITMDVYSLVDPGRQCTQMLKPFETTIQLGSFPTGHYSVWLNGEKLGEFDS